MLMHPGTQERLIAESVLGAGSTVREGSIQSDSLVATLYVNSISSGDLTITVYTLTDTGKETTIITFPAVSAPSSNLLIRKAAISLQRFRVVASYTGVCDYEVYIRAIDGAGESSAKILGNTNWRVSQADVTTVPIVLIPAALDDRAGVLVKNWSTVSTVYIAESLAKADVNIGYPLAPRDALAMDIAAGAAVYAVADAGTADCRITEAGG